MSVKTTVSVHLFLSVWIGLALPTDSIAQQKITFNAEFTDGTGRALGILSNGDPIIGGDFFTGPNTSSITILRVNGSGQQQWKKDFNFQEMNFVRSMAIDQNDFIYVLGEQQDKGGKEVVFILKIDKDGKLIWHKLYGQRASYNDASSLKQDRAGNLVFILQRNQVIRVDQDGNVLSKQTALWNSLDVVEFTFDSQDNLIVVGDIDDNIYAMTVDQKGSVVNTFSYKGAGKDWAYDIAGFDEGFLVLGRTDVADKQHYLLAFLDQNLKEKWHRDYDCGGRGKLGVRNGEEIVMTYYGTGENSGGNLCFLDKDGNSKSIKNYGGNLTGAIKIKGEEIVIVGKKNGHVWLVKVE